jgi:hypothetical protein
MAAFLAITTLGIAQAQTPSTFFVAPDGDDAFPGTIDQPFRTLERARTAVRGVNQNMTADIHVYLRAGTYVLTAPLQLTSQDSGTNGFSVVWEGYQGEDAILSGGSVVTGWSQTGGLWRALVGNVESRTLFVNGKRATRARSTDGMGITFFTDENGNRLGYRLPTGSNMPFWGNPLDIEFVSRVVWKEYRCGVAGFSESQPVEVTMDGDCWQNAQAHAGAEMGALSWVENALELLDQPGEWYLKRSTGELFYKPLPGEDMTSATAVLPTLEQVIVGTGTPSDKIRNITFRDLIFAYTTWLRPDTETGFPELQGNLFIVGGVAPALQVEQPLAAVVLSQAENIEFEDNVVARLGSAGIRFGRGSTNNRVARNHFYDVSSSAVLLGNEQQGLDLFGNAIENNYIHNTGAEYHGAAGVWIGNARQTLLRHNEIHDVPYDGVSIGWNFGYNLIGNGENRLLNNLIHDHMKVLADGGGIYSLGATDPPNEYAYNVVHGQRSTDGTAIYLDDGSRYVNVHHNALFDSAQYTFLAKGQDHTVTDNWWLNDSSRDILFVFAATNVTYTFNNNTCFLDGAAVFCGSVVSGNVQIQTSADVPPGILAGAGIEPQYQYIKTKVIPSCPAVSIGNPTVTEGSGSSVDAVFPVWLSCPVPGATVTVNFATAPGTAGEADFTPVSGTLSFDPGDTTGTITVPVLGDSLDEAVETFFVDLSNPANAGVASGRGTASIVDDDPHPLVSIGNVAVMEGNTGTGNAVLLVSLSASSGQTAHVTYATQDGTATAPSDYTPANGVLTFAPGVVSQTVNVPIVGDTVWEPEETFFVNLSAPQNLTLGDGQGEADIVDDELPLLSIGDARLPEGPPATTREVTVSLNAPRIVNVTVNYQTLECTASQGSDYAPLSGTLTFLPGETSKTITVGGLGDSTFEASETYLLELSSPVQANMLDGRGQVTLVNDDPSPNPPLGLPPADFNGDGMTDIIWRHETSGQLAAWRMESINLVSGSIFQTLADLDWKVVGTADFNADGETDIVWRHDLSGQIAFWFMNDLTLNGGTLIEGKSGAGWRVHGTGDFNADGKPDFLWRNETTGALTAWLMNGTTLLADTPLDPGSVTDLDWRPVGTGDFNHDGKTDILWRHQGSTQVVVWLMDGVNLSGGGFLIPSTLDPIWLPSATGDFNGDGHTDILWRHQVSGELLVWLMSGMTQKCAAFLNPDRMTDANWKVAGPR